METTIYEKFLRYEIVTGSCCKKIKAARLYDIIGLHNMMNLSGKRFHLIGAGGIGMSGLAQLLVKNSAIVKGSDLQESSVTERLGRMGCQIKIGHSMDNLDSDTDTVVISAAIKDDNPEFKSALQRGLDIKKYSQLLGILMNCYEGMAISGTHGKSTTTGWLVYCMKEAGIDTNFVVGADINQLGNSSGVGNSKFFVVEACEYDRSFLNLYPKIGCILNIEQDHMDYYKDEDDIVDAFTQFALNIRKDGVLIANGEDKNTKKVLSRVKDKVKYETFGLDENCNFKAKELELIDGTYSFKAYYNQSMLGKFRIAIPGTHNVYNALAVIAMWVNAGFNLSELAGIMGEFTGMDRRLMVKGKINGITCVDDYAHHPTEIKASLKAIRQQYQPNKIWCVFQPHQYSRTRFLLNDFAESFKLADVTIVPEIYFVRDTEAMKKEVNAQVLVEQIKKSGSDALFINSFDGICEHLKTNVKSGELVATMGAGDIWKVADGYIQWLRGNS